MRLTRKLAGVAGAPEWLESPCAGEAWPVRNVDGPDLLVDGTHRRHSACLCVTRVGAGQPLQAEGQTRES